MKHFTVFKFTNGNAKDSNSAGCLHENQEAILSVIVASLFIPACLYPKSLNLWSLSLGTKSDKANPFMGASPHLW